MQVAKTKILLLSLTYRTLPVIKCFVFQLKMPLVIITGTPSSGKTTTALKLKEFLETTRECQVHLVSENDILKRESFDRNVVFSDSKLEKQIRSEIKSETIRLLTKDSVVICDALNYIKGLKPTLHSFLVIVLYSHPC